MEDESYLEPLPNWAIGRAEGDYTLTNASLPTKDGRCTGNAINLGEVESKRAFPTFLVATEAGNLMRLTKGEMERMFHPPVFIALNPLPAQQAALLRSQDKIFPWVLQNANEIYEIDADRNLNEIATFADPDIAQSVIDAHNKEFFR